MNHGDSWSREQVIDLDFKCKQYTLNPQGLRETKFSLIGTDSLYKEY